jgi:nucleotide-binding universal stress UspA family protein
MTETFEPDGVVVGDDGSAGAAAAVGYAVEEARRRGCRLHIVRAYTLLSSSRPADVPFGVVPTEGELARAAQVELESRWADLVAGSGLEVELRGVHAKPADALIAASRTAAVVVVGARGVGGFEALLIGSVADQVVDHASCPVIVVRP